MTIICVGMGDSTSTATTQYRYWSYGGAKWREGIRSGHFVRDKTLTATGWDGIEDTDWENVYQDE